MHVCGRFNLAGLTDTNLAHNLLHYCETQEIGCYSFMTRKGVTCRIWGQMMAALILPYSACDYLDYQPTIQATGAVVDNQRWLPVGEWDDLALWLVPDLGNKQEKYEVCGCQVICAKA